MNARIVTNDGEVIDDEGRSMRAQYNDSPIHESSTPPQNQSLSPFYSGLIPAEVRQHIFTYVLTPTPIANTGYKKDHFNTRPGSTHKECLPITLLQTCRRIYLELYHLPFSQWTHRFWHHTAPPARNYPLTEAAYFGRFHHWQLSFVRSIELNVQMYVLEGQFLQLCDTISHHVPNLTDLKIIIRRRDWWWNESNYKLGINPYTGKWDTADMERDMLASVRGQKLTIPEAAWGQGFQHLSSLKNLEFEFETSEEKKGELERIVNWSKSWEFPMGERGILSMWKEKLGSGELQIMEPRWWEWRGGLGHWTHQCPFCQPGWGSCSLKNINREGILPGCEERKGLMAEGKGPLLVVANCKWKLKGVQRGEGERS